MSITLLMCANANGVPEMLPNTPESVRDALTFLRELPEEDKNWYFIVEQYNDFWIVDVHRREDWKTGRNDFTTYHEAVKYIYGFCAALKYAR